MVDDKELLAAIVLSEASVEGKEGMQAVLNTMMNRTGTVNLQTLLDEAKSLHAYEGYTKGKKKGLSTFIDSYKKTKDAVLQNQWSEVLAFIDLAVTKDSEGKSQLSDITGGATHYLNPDVQKELGRSLPSWALWESGSSKKIGSHLFGIPLTADDVKKVEFSEAWSRGRSIMGPGSKFEWIDRKEYLTD